ncbi:DHHW family protein [Limnohabitans sp. T6-20]|uniref:DHHW family protein n=1 Tax=Limnohabitans sp. T6-20 TaxID=1100725 RepID=UPI000D373774|nr:DHHW family protein [Limnohabitans sp. T6-20]PUE12332.1 hypothetical protein B9Z33_01965 [Limnohabitans sp. T6-20]
MQQHHSTPYMDWIQTIVFTGLLIGLGVFFVMTPKDAVSEGEKRKLAQFPEFSWSAMGHGTYMKQIDDFVADNFVFRYSLTDVAGQIKQWRGWAQDDIQVFSDKGNHQGGGATPAAHEPPAAAARQPVAPASNQAKPSQTASEGVAQTRRPDGSTGGSGVEAAVVSQSDDTPYQNIESVIIYKNRAVQMLGGSPQMAVPFAAVLARYQQELPQTNIYFMPIPIGADYYLPTKVNKGVMREKLVIDHALSLLPQQVRPVHAYEKLAQHTSEYVYFNTDHHWTGLGAYYAYTAFAEAAHITPLPLSALTKKEIPNFLGTLYHRTLSPVLKSKGDTVEYYKVPVQTSVKFYAAGSRQGQPTQLYAEYARGAGAYGVFLGGDYPMMKITSDVKNGRKIVVLKDSYGNAFVPYLASHYEEVYVLDYRHFNGNIKTLIQQEGIQDLLFAHNSYVFLSGYTVQRERGFLTGGVAVARKASTSEAAQ